MNRRMTVSQLARYLRGVFDDEELLHDVTLSGEVADISYSDRHTFLVLADGAYSVRCVHFSSRDNIQKGVKVALRGSVDFYDKRGTVSFTYDEFFLQGEGDKNAKLAALKKKLFDLGYFEDRPQLPKYIAHVTVVTSPDGAAIRDFERVVHDKNPFVGISVCPVKVQGEGAAAQIASTVKSLQSSKTDAIVLCRGGGSEEDLDCFNDEAVAVAVAQSAIPVISAVGHEINYSLSDFCAGTRAGTPSIAGEIVNAHAGKIVEDILVSAAAMRAALEQRYKREVLRLNRCGTATIDAVAARINEGYGALRLNTNRAMYAVKQKLFGKAHRLTSAAERLRSAASARYSDGNNRLKNLKAVLLALDPHRIIKVGYAAVRKGGVRVYSAAGLAVNDEVQLVFADGTATATITDKE